MHTWSEVGRLLALGCLDRLLWRVPVWHLLLRIVRLWRVSLWRSWIQLVGVVCSNTRIRCETMVKCDQTWLDNDARGGISSL